MKAAQAGRDRRQGRSNPDTQWQSSSLLEDLPATLFIHAVFKAANAVQIRVSIDEIEPDAWRRQVLPAHWNLASASGNSGSIQLGNYHLYEFRIGGGEVETLMEDAADDDPQVSIRDRLVC